MPGGVLVLNSDDADGNDFDREEPGLGLDDRRGGFADTRSRLFEGKDLDTPTYIRKQINLDKTLAKKKKEFGSLRKS